MSALIQPPVSTAGLAASGANTDITSLQSGVGLTAPVITGLATGGGVASAATASTLVARDASGDINANNANLGYTTTATAAGTTTLTVASTALQYFTGSTTQTVLLPVTSTLVLGQRFVITNNSTGIATVKSSGANTIVAMDSGTSATFTCILTSGTGTASWNLLYAPAYSSAGTLTIPGGVIILGGDGGCAASAVIGNTGGSSCKLVLTPPCGASGAQATLSRGDNTTPIKFYFGGGSQLPDQAVGMVVAPNGYAEGVQALSGAGAVNITAGATAVTSTGASQALTLIDGYNGQIKHIAHVVDGGSWVLTPTTKSGYSTITSNNAGDAVTLQFFTTAGWCIMGSFGVTIA